MRTFWIVYFAIAILGGASAIILIGYPDDGRKGVPTAFGRYERANSRGWR